MGLQIQPLQNIQSTSLGNLNKMAKTNYIYISAHTMTADKTGDEISLKDFNGYSFASVWTGTPAGNIIVQVSYDNGTTWVAVDTTAAGGGAGSDVFAVVDPTYPLVRLFYDFTSSTGVLNTWFNGNVRVPVS